MPSADIGRENLPATANRLQQPFWPWIGRSLVGLSGRWRPQWKMAGS